MPRTGLEFLFLFYLFTQHLWGIEKLLVLIIWTVEKVIELRRDGEYLVFLLKQWIGRIWRYFNLVLSLRLHDLREEMHDSAKNKIEKTKWQETLRDCSLVQFSCSVVSDSLQPHELQHARSPCPLPTPGVHSDSRPSSQWCHPAISSSVVPFSSCPQSLPASESFPISQLFASGGQSTGVSALASFLSKKSQGWSPSERTGWISLQSKGYYSAIKRTK